MKQEADCFSYQHFTRRNRKRLMREVFLYEKDIPEGCYCCDFRDPKYDHCIALRDGDDYISCSQPKQYMNGKKPVLCPIHSIESIREGDNNAGY